MKNTIRNFIPALIILIALATRLVPGARTIDDSFITFRYARNILASEGFVYNPGEHVQGTTTPLYTLLMVGLGSLTGGAQAPFPQIALLLNAVSDALTCLLLILLGRRLKVEWAGWLTALLWAIAPHSVTFAIGGLETSLYILLLVGMVFTYTQSSYTLCAALAAFALLTRPDALLLAVPLIVDRLVRARRGEILRPAELAAFLIPTLAWATFAWVYFGSPLPNSVVAKLAAYRLEPASSLIRLLQHYTDPFLARPILGPASAAVGFVLYPFLYILGARHAWRVEKRLLAWMIYPWLYLAAFSLPNPLIFRWYLAPPLPPYYFFIFLGAGTLLHGLFDKLSFIPPAWGRALVGVALILPIISSLASWTLHQDHGPDRPAPDMAFIKMELLYRQAAEITKAGPGDTIAAGDVGVLGYYTPARILDTVGLNSPLSLRYYPLDPAAYVTNYAIPPDLIIDQKPDWVIFMEVYGRRSLLQDQRFLKAYTLRETLPTDIFGSRGMLIYVRSIP